MAFGGNSTANVSLIAPQAAKDGRCPAKGWLGVDDPVGLKERVDKGVPLRRVPELLAATGEVVVVVRAL